MATARLGSSLSRLVNRPITASPLRPSLKASRFHKAIKSPNRQSIRNASSYTDSYQSKKTIMTFIIGANVGVTVLWFTSALQSSKRPPELALRRFMAENFVTSLAHLKQGKYWTLLTSAISQQSPFHLLGNVVTFYAFSSVLLNAAPMLTGPGFVALCAGSAFTGSIGWAWWQYSRRQNRPALGASGMVAGVGAAAALTSPNSKMLLMGIVPAPLWTLVVGYAFLDSYLLDSGSSVGHAAHLGGYLFGAVYYFAAMRRGRIPSNPFRR